MIDQTLINQVVEALIVFIAALYAIYKHKQTSSVITAMSDPVSVTEPEKKAAIAVLPERSYKMSDETLKWLCAAETTADQELITRQVREAEKDQLFHYQIKYSAGGYIIEYGLIKSSWRVK
jgi:hypothetical protein